MQHPPFVGPGSNYKHFASIAFIIDFRAGDLLSHSGCLIEGAQFDVEVERNERHNPRRRERRMALVIPIVSTDLLH